MTLNLVHALGPAMPSECDRHRIDEAEGKLFYN